MIIMTQNCIYQVLKEYIMKKNPPLSETHKKINYK